MGLAQDLLSVLELCRAIPGQLGLREHAVYLLEGVWSGTNTGGGTETLTTTQLLENGQNPKVRWLTDEQLALGGMPADSIEIGPLTSEHATGGLDLDLIIGTALDAGDTLHVRVVGPKHPSPGQRYQITSWSADHAMHRMLRCKPA